MKHFLFSLFSLLSLSVYSQPKFTPELEFALQLKVSIEGVERVGVTPHGHRQCIPITGGTFEGPNIKGTVLAGGADYQLNLEGRTELEAIYNIRTDDGVTIHVRNVGIICQDGGKSYFYTVPKFEAPVDSKYAWLNNAIFICRPSDEAVPGGIGLNVWKVK